jgi:ATP-dependent helicase/nuclease subunit A
MAQLTPAQIEAIQARGNVLVEAGAGAGKTRTLVERCVACVSNPADGVSLDEILMVTFTEAAAAEMRQRLRDRLQEQAAEAGENPWLAEQLALVDTACISTLHSFCLQLVREHFYALELDPQLTVLAAEQSHLLEREALDALLQKHYAGGTPIAEAVQQLIFNQGRGWDQPVRNLVLRLHHYTQTLSDPAGWFRRELARLREPVPDRWDKWLRQGFEEWCGLWLPVLQALSPDNPKAASCAAIVAEFYPLSAPGSGAGSQREVARTSVSTGQGIRRDSQGSTGGAHRRDTGTVEFEPLVARAEIADALVQILSLDQDWPPKKKTALRAPLETFFEEAAFLHSVARVTNASPGSAPADPLVEDWNWVRPHMIALLELAQEFGERYGQAKHELGALDFHDLEQFALRLLRDPQTGAPSPVAAEWRAKFRLLFVDEYQDINEAQDAILQALGRSGPEANRFLVGDVKQSIYRFRLANPHIFQGYAAAWRNDADSGMVIPLADNFRSHAAILEFVNGLFSSLMQREVGGVEYDEAARLRFGAPEQREPMALGPLPGFDGQATTQSARGGLTSATSPTPRRRPVCWDFGSAS